MEKLRKMKLYFPHPIKKKGNYYIVKLIKICLMCGGCDRQFSCSCEKIEFSKSNGE